MSGKAAAGFSGQCGRRNKQNHSRLFSHTLRNKADNSMTEFGWRYSARNIARSLGKSNEKADFKSNPPGIGGAADLPINKNYSHRKIKTACRPVLGGAHTDPVVKVKNAVRLMAEKKAKSLPVDFAHPAG